MHSIEKSLENRYCEQFQNSLSTEMIDRIWKSFREAGNSLEGRIGRLNFKKVMNRFNIRNQKFLDRLFERFRLDKIPEIRSEKQQIDLQDLVIGLAILSRISFEEKVKYVFYLTDLDEDGCLDLQQIENMVQRIEKIFCKENAAGKVESYSLLYDIALRKAQRNVKDIVFLLKKNNLSLKNDDSSLITSDQFIEGLKESKDLYQEQKYLPLNLSLAQVLNNNPKQISIRIHEENINEFKDFRKELYHILNKNPENESGANIVKYPGKIQVIKNEKTIDILPPYEKVSEKRSNKLPAGKNKTNNGIKTHDKNDPNYDQKAAEQTLQSYKTKVKKMIQTKMDPRLNVHFQKMIRK